ncbi:16S rRNA (cytidine(1402)-2'-O)-methyltransferase [Geomonas sp. RF6]|uniref:16S rRNA (cytidine(1402)-2'-O)-methyltransferase n=1 Tax=Geomonas sp. RF6 TaxID=2897342 RepID=UPI001E49DFE1|nr:16S rRNA (cytidine(1402)-2'-O)-methyltransferase [Geomonas sp. RF6]UFS72726.1 16S rRNA (cytidine(1402)-2'-O)-methyltransferase [Geomonas sp. RF6]
MSPGTLYIVATPIGNLEDITLRALRILKEVDLIAAEDTRHSRKLLSHFGISKPLTSYFDHNKTLKGAQILEKLQEGLSVALITDAGTPCISDPGYQLVRDAVAAGISVVPLPGACAAIVALSASGLPTDHFTFAGFLPNKQGKRKERLQALSSEKGVVIFYESPKRVVASLRDMLEILGDREIVVGRELTKMFEEFLRGRVSAVIDQIEGREVRGEVAILVSAAEEDVEQEAPPLEDLLRRYLDEGVTVKDAVKRVVAETGLPKGVVYAEALRVKG